MSLYNLINYFQIFIHLTFIDSVLPLTYAIGYTTFSPKRSYKVPTVSTTSLKPTLDYAPKFARIYSKVASPLLLPTR